MEAWVIDGMVEVGGVVDLVDGVVCSCEADARAAFDAACSQRVNELDADGRDEEEDRDGEGQVLSVTATVKSSSGHALIRMSKFVLPEGFFHDNQQ